MMILIANVGDSTVKSNSILEFIVLLILFVLILFAAYLATKFVAQKGLLQPRTQNIQVLEQYRVHQNKVIAIVRVGKKYMVVGITKDHIEFLMEVSEEDITFEKTGGTTANVTFTEVMKKIVTGQKKCSPEEEEASEQREEE